MFQRGEGPNGTRDLLRSRRDLLGHQVLAAMHELFGRPTFCQRDRRCVDQLRAQLFWNRCRDGGTIYLIVLSEPRAEWSNRRPNRASAFVSTTLLARC